MINDEIFVLTCFFKKTPIKFKDDLIHKKVLDFYSNYEKQGYGLNHYRISYLLWLQLTKG